MFIIPFAILIAVYANAAGSNSLSQFVISKFGISLPFATLSTVQVISPEVTYVGRLHEGVEQYLGIFYAQDTSGSNRFAPPRPVVHTPGTIIDASAHGAWCPQGTGGPPLPFASPITNISENCLSLGITRPKGTSAAAKLPVIVWMHGGGHALGSYADRLYVPEGLVKASTDMGKPVIVVGINYRLGMFGFASSEALQKIGYTNAGLRDQRAAFDWVKQNIADFGGDPENVISIGQSVGASDTGLQMLSYGGSKGVPFDKAVMMSGAPGLTFNIKSDLVKNNTAAVAKELDCVMGGDSQSAETLKCLQNAPMDRLTNISVANSRAARPPFGEAFFYPTYDGDYIPERPSELFRQGKFVSNIPVMTSWVTNDGAWYAPPTTATNEEALASFYPWLWDLSKETLAELLKLYPESDFEQISKAPIIGGLSPQYYRAAQMNRDLWFTCPVLDFAYHHALHSPTSTPTYLYEHNATRFTPIFQDIVGVPFWGVSHLSDIPYMLNNDVAAGGDNSATAKALALKMSTALIDFAYTGNPDPNWPTAFEKNLNHDESDTSSSMRLMLFQHEEDGRQSGPVTINSVPSDTKTMSDATLQRTRAVEWEKLFERCNFINSAKVREEMGV